MKVKNIILTALLACMLYPSGQAMKRKREDTEQQRDAKKTRGWQSLTSSNISRDGDTNDYFSNLSYDDLIQILYQLAKSCDLSTPQGIIDAIKVLSKLKRINPRFNNLLTPQEIGHILIAAGANIHATINNPGHDYHGWTALHFAAESGHAAAINNLIADGANVHATINNPGHWTHGMTALHLAARWGHTNVIQALIGAVPLEQRVFFVNVRDNYGRTTLHLAAHEISTDVINALIAAIPDPEQKVTFVKAGDNSGRTSLHLAIFRGYANIILALIDAIPDEQKAAFVNATINNPGSFFHGMTALHLAILMHHIDAIHTLIAAGADVNATIDNPGHWNHGMTALHFAADSGQANAINSLIAVGADVHADLLQRLQNLGIEIPWNQIVH